MSTMPGGPRSSVIDHRLVTTCFELDGYRIVRSLGVVRGITVRSRSVIGAIGAALHSVGLGCRFEMPPDVARFGPMFGGSV